MTDRGGVKLWIKLDLAGRGEIGPGKILLLRGIRECGSIAGAARSMGMSYRRAWQLVDELNRMFEGLLVETHIGGSARGGARLTPLGAAVVARYDEISRRANRSCRALLREFGRSRA